MKKKFFFNKQKIDRKLFLLAYKAKNEWFANWIVDSRKIFCNGKKVKSLVIWMHCRRGPHFEKGHFSQIGYFGQKIKRKECTFYIF